jgi:hypothetical protein
VYGKSSEIANLNYRKTLKRLALFRKYEGIRRSHQIEEVLTSNTCFHRVGDVGVRSNTAGEDVLALTTGSTTLAMSLRPISGI